MTQTLIEKLEEYIKEEAKINYSVTSRIIFHDIREILEDAKHDTQHLFTHPQLADATVKDAERYRWLSENMSETHFDPKSFSGEGFADIRMKFLMPPLVSFSCVGLPISLDEAIDEAMKAEREDTKA